MNIKTLLATTLFILVMLSACSGNAPQPTPEPVLPTQAPTQPEQPSTPTDVPTSVPTETALPTAEVKPTDTTATSAQAVSFTNEIMPIFNTHCVECHGRERVREGLNMMTYDNLMAGSFNGPVVAPGNADGSLLVELITKGKMPDRGPKVTPEDLQRIINWINQGAINN
ncbi:MAG: c-type cytochrome [Anaerolineales bacterium]|nr:c-type cytochrome [Anaerolineales bacterium]